ncbi:MAG: tetratricopeptide repeat protein [Bacillota bacterium]
MQKQNKDIVNRMEQGINLLKNAEYEKAIKHFQEIIKLDSNNEPFARNNLGLVYFHKGDLEQALETIKPNIEKSAQPNPFGHALAAQIYLKLGNKTRAVSELDLAVKDFEQGVSSCRNTSNIPKYWKEYLIKIFETAGALEDHRLAYNVYRNWQNLSDNSEIKFMAGAAAFNLGRFRQN